jgi:hypothetical protein
MTRSTVLWNADERRYRAPVRLVVRFLTVALLAVLGTVTAELVAAVLWPDRSFAYVLVGSTLGLGLGAVAGLLVALTAAAGYVLTGRLGLAVGFHAAWNVALGILFGHPVSGTVPPASVLVLEVSGPAAWTGGAFGPEAGLLGVLAGLTALAYVRVVEGSLRIHPALLRPAFRGDDAVGTSVVEVSTGPEASPPPR